MELENAQEFLNNEIDNNIKRMLYLIIESGMNHAQMLLEDSLFQNSAFQPNIKSRLCNYCINRSFESDMRPNDFPLAVNVLSTNNFLYKAVFLESNNMVINVAKCKNRDTIFPSRAKFRLDRCKKNKFRQNTLFDVSCYNQDNIKIEGDKIFGLLTYYLDGNEILHADLLIPDVNMKNPLAICDLKQNYSFPNFQIYNNNDVKEKQLAKLKQEILKQPKIQ